jgi:CDP-diacylglycerol--glycerol-3-phosphate 3-phosphatidyltransferase
LKEQGSSSLTLANKITIARMLFIPLFILLVLYFERSVACGEPAIALRWVATGIFLAIFLLDALDGYVARKRKEISRLGTLLDPLTDKAMLLSALILLSLPSSAFSFSLPVWFVVLVISRDVLLVGGALIIQNLVGKVTVRPRISGKVTTFFQAMVILWVLLGIKQHLFMGVIGIAACLTFISGVQYVIDGIGQLERAGGNGRQQV